MSTRFIPPLIITSQYKSIVVIYPVSVIWSDSSTLNLNVRSFLHSFKKGSLIHSFLTRSIFPVDLLSGSLLFYKCYKPLIVLQKTPTSFILSSLIFRLISEYLTPKSRVLFLKPVVRLDLPLRTVPKVVSHLIMVSLWIFHSETDDTIIWRQLPICTSSLWSIFWCRSEVRSILPVNWFIRRLLHHSLSF